MIMEFDLSRLSRSLEPGPVPPLCSFPDESKHTAGCPLSCVLDQENTTSFDNTSPHPLRPSSSSYITTSAESVEFLGSLAPTTMQKVMNNFYQMEASLVRHLNYAYYHKPLFSANI